MDIDKKILELKEGRVPFCIATVVKVVGSAPRHAGSKMIVTAKESFGTVGGGGVEHQAIEDAKDILKRRAPECKSYELTEKGIQPCGGRIEVFFEPVVPPKSVVVFGAGHVGEALCPLLAELGFDVTIVDERKERISLGAFKSARTRIGKLPSEVLPTIEFNDELHIICLTHKHIHDEDIVEYCLDKPFKYLGLISSRKKWAVFKKHYREKGFTDGQMDRVATPIGLDIGAETPFEIAVAICAELIQLRAKPEDYKKGVGHF